MSSVGRFEPYNLMYCFNLSEREGDMPLLLITPRYSEMEVSEEFKYEKEHVFTYKSRTLIDDYNPCARRKIDNHEARSKLRVALCVSDELATGWEHVKMALIVVVEIKLEITYRQYNKEFDIGYNIYHPDKEDEKAPSPFRYKLGTAVGPSNETE